MALTVADLVATFRVDKSGLSTGLTESKAEIDGFTRDAAGRLHDLEGKFGLPDTVW